MEVRKKKGRAVVQSQKSPARRAKKLTDEQVLQQIGLSRPAAQIYLFLVEQLPYARGATYINEQFTTKLPDTTLFRAVHELLAKGFIIYSNEERRHRTYRAVKLAWALESYALYQRELVLPVLQKQAELGKIHR